MLAPGADVSGLEVQRDGIGLPRDAWGVNAPIDPGAHVIEVRAPGHKARKLDVTVKPGGEHATVTIAPLDAEAANPTTPPPGPTPLATVPAVGMSSAPAASPAPQHPRPGQRTAGWILGGLGVAAAATGIGVAVSGQNEHDTAVASAIAGNASLATSQESTASNTKLAGYATIGAGGAFLVAGVVLLLTAPSSHDSKPAAALLVLPWFLEHGAGGGHLARVVSS
jgi:hypothetical protein